MVTEGNLPQLVFSTSCMTGPVYLKSQCGGGAESESEQTVPCISHESSEKAVAATGVLPAARHGLGQGGVALVFV